MTFTTPARLLSAWGLALGWLACLWVVAAPGLNTSLDTLLDTARQRYDAPTVATVENWQTMIEQARTSPESERLFQINDFFNNIVAFSTDQQAWRQLDYWATPLETLDRRQGDCEDFVIAKYFSLLLAGVPDDKLRLVYVKARLGDGANRRTQAHMVLAYYHQPNAEPLILDNLVMEVTRASTRTDLTPIFSFNSAQLWLDNQTIQQPEARLSRWRDLLARAQEEGLD